MNSTENKTAEVVYQMMTENTGIHMMDSGGGSGRMWQRNQMKSLEDFTNEPAITMDWGPTISIFHFFVEHLEHDPVLQNKIDKYAADHPKDSWSDILNGVAAEQDWQCSNSYNTYNDDVLLSQVFQGFEMNDNDFLVIQLHNGADVRGGYTSPYAFRYKHGWEDFVCGMIDYNFFCSNDDCDFSVTVHGLDIYDNDGCPVDLDWQHIQSSTCPKCNNNTLTPEVHWA